MLLFPQLVTVTSHDSRESTKAGLMPRVALLSAIACRYGGYNLWI